MEDLLTTRQVQELLHVDRITVYRMLSDGRLKGVKIGQQWRFPSREVDRLLSGTPAAAESGQVEMDSNFPAHCVQAIQDLFADVSQVGAHVIDLQGEPLTQPSHPCSLCQTLGACPAGQAACRASWKEFAVSGIDGNKFFTCHAGLHYVGASIIEKGQPIGLFLAGPFYWQAAEPHEESERMHRLAGTYDLDLETLREAAQAIPVITAQQQSQVESWPFTAARAVQSILVERTGFVERLQQIANLTQLS
jgi:excisionase family DNA binding protein